MKITKKALELTKKFAAGAPCPINFDYIKTTMFWPFYEIIAQKQNKKEIDEEVVKQYWFEIHNNLVVERFRRKELSVKQAENCMVRSGRQKNKLACIHGGIVVCDINEKEAKILKKRVYKL